MATIDRWLPSVPINTKPLAANSPPPTTATCKIDARAGCDRRSDTNDQNTHGCRGGNAVGVGVAVITATAAILLTRTMTPLSLLCALVALVSGNVLWWLGDRDARQMASKVRPLAEAIRDAERQREHDNAV